MVSNGVPYDNTAVVLETHVNVDEESCKQRCISNTRCAVIVLYIGTTNVCLLYDATQYSNGSADSGTATFLKSCVRTFCMLTILLTLQFICSSVFFL